MDHTDAQRDDHLGGEAEAPASAVGALLRASRFRLGEDLRDVARVLRIRYPYLEAIEEGRYADLPGAAYAVGFVRGYAEHLGLDSEEIVRRYKAETAGGPKKPRLVFPSPVTESVMPGGAAMFIGIVLAGLAYGVWYVGTSDDNPIADIIAPIPERLSEILNRKATPDHKPAVAAEAAATPEPQAVPAAGEAPNAAEPVAEDHKTAEVPPSGPVAPLADTAAADAAKADAVKAETRKAEAEAAKMEMAKAEMAKAEAAKAEMAKQEIAKAEAVKAAAGKAEALAESVKTEASAAAAPATDGPQTASPPAAPAEPAVAAEPKKPAGPAITVRAKAPSWIQIRDDVAKTLVMTRLLRPGDVYQVPDRSGLSLVTGNAGALEIQVDGEAVPAIGGSGAVRRSVALDADKLKAGKAVSE